ncbi:MAG: VWA domain-containing protein [Spirochaetaceae bacterium]|nr:VWA domain-containing protein [Spirochaetaceae bacterium]
MQFDAPWAFLLAPVAAALPLLRHWTARRQAGLTFSSAALASSVAPSWRQRMAWLPLALQVASLLLLVVALARPREGQEQVVDVSRGVAIELVVDRSSSMRVPMAPGQDSPSRLQAAKAVLARFIRGDDSGLAGRSHDLIGLITFARYAETILPLTLAHDAAGGFLRSIELAGKGSAEDGTAIGDAIALAAARLHTAEEELRASGAAATYEIKSKVIVLLTDGINNPGPREPLAAAELARDWGITVHAIGIAADETVRSSGNTTLFRLGRREIDEAALRAIAETTGGLFRIAGDARALHEVYREIDALERSEIESVRYVSYRERFVPWALAAAACMFAATLLSATVLRRSP